MREEPVHFPNLNALRFAAASMVVFMHTEQIKGYHNFKSYYYDYPALFRGGHLAVIFFFVLSGFLITHIILKQLQLNNFSVTDFYKKRVVRIWPVYYFLITIGLFVLPAIPIMVHHSKWIGNISDLSTSNFKKLVVFYYLVLPNISVYFGLIQYVAHTWSIGVEEQFYLIWPLLMKWFSNHIIKLLLCIILVVWAIRLGFNLLNIAPLAAFINYFRIDSMAIGGIGASILLEHQGLKKYFINRLVEIFALGVAFGLYFGGVNLGNVSDEIFSFFFALIVLNASSNPKTLMKFEKIKVLDYFGKVSYGIYMYHPITASLALIILQWIHPSYMSSLVSNVAFFVFAFIITIGAAVASYELVEKRIMKWGRAKWLTGSDRTNPNQQIIA